MSQLPPWFSPNHPGISGSLDFFSLTSGIWRLRPCHLGVFQIPHFFSTKNHVEKTHTKNPSKPPKKIWVQEKPKESQLMAPLNCKTKSSGSTATKKTSLPGDPKHWVHSSGQQALGLANLPGPQSAVFVKDSPKNWREIWVKLVNWWILTLHYQRQKIVSPKYHSLDFFWHHRTSRRGHPEKKYFRSSCKGERTQPSPHLVVLVQFHQLQQLCDLTADLSSWFGHFK